MTNGQNKNSNKITLEDFNADEKSLLAKGIIAIILANEEVTSAEIKYLKKHCKAQSEIDAFFEMGKKMGVSFYVMNEMIQIEGSRFLLYTREKGMLEELKKVFKK